MKLKGPFRTPRDLPAGRRASLPAVRLRQAGAALATARPSASEGSQRVGLGNDLHRLAEGRKLTLGGVRIPFPKGPEGHSDGDALAHSICDALLGAAGLGDIGQHFPDTAPEWRNVSSLQFLRHVRKLLQQCGYSIVNIDATIGLERPKLAAYVPRMRKKLAAALGAKVDQISIKAKTAEGLGAVGRGEAVRADVIALIQRGPPRRA